MWDAILESFQILIGEVYNYCVLSVWRLKVVEILYSDQELGDMHYICGLTDGNAVISHNLYRMIMSR
jgi:hypothetical protein